MMAADAALVVGGCGELLARDRGIPQDEQDEGHPVARRGTHAPARPASQRP